MSKIWIYITMFFLAASCHVSKKVSRDLSASEMIIEKSIEAHGGNAFENQTFGFVFRGGKYQFRFDENGYRYQSIKLKDSQELKSILTNSTFEFYVDGQKEATSAKKMRAYENSLNSVIYFVALPYKLRDPAVISELLEDQEIDGRIYHQIKVTFEQEGGGQDHEDVFHYWIDQENYRMKYMAYSYHTGDGGVRFREGFNDRKVGKVLFQDYRNYKVEVGTDMSDLPEMFEMGKLKLLSEIRTEDPEVIK